MALDQILTLAAVGLVFASAMSRTLSTDFAALLSLSLLVLTGVLEPARAAEGFGNPTLLTVASMFVMAEALQRTGAANGLASLVTRYAARGTRPLLIMLLPIVVVLSGVMSNTGVVVLLLPIILSASQANGTSPSRVLLPLSYASITGGTLTLVGTTTTLLVDGLLRQEGLPGLGLFDIMPMGLAFSVVAVVWLVLAGPRLLPDRQGLVTAITPGTTHQYMTEVRLRPDSRMVGKPVSEAVTSMGDVRVLQVIRGEETFWSPLDGVRLKSGDVLLLKADSRKLMDALALPDVEGPDQTAEDVSSVDLALAEMMVLPGSSFEGTSVTKARLRTRFGVVVIAVLRRGAHLRSQLGELDLMVGDVLLVQGPVDALHRLEQEGSDLMMLGGATPVTSARRRAPLAVAIALLALGLAAAGVVPLMIATLLGGGAMVATGCLTSGQAYRSIHLRILVIIGAMLALGAAVKQTGLAGIIANGLVTAGADLGPVGVLAMIYLATAIVTELVTNAATAGIMIPIALAAAAKMEVSYEPFVFAVALAASCSFLTPVGYQTNLLVYGPGGYRLSDYLRLGGPLALLLWGLAILLLPIVYPF